MSRDAFDTPSLYEQTNYCYYYQLRFQKECLYGTDAFDAYQLPSSRPHKVRVLCDKYDIFF